MGLVLVLDLNEEFSSPILRNIGLDWRFLYLQKGLYRDRMVPNVFTMMYLSPFLKFGTDSEECIFGSSPSGIEENQ